jgi:hypothetical protein
MSALTPYLRQPEALGQHARYGPATADAVQTELEAMQSIVRALATISDNAARARVMAWASAVFPAPEGRPGVPPASVQIHAVPEPASETSAVESFHSEGRGEIRSAAIARPTPVVDGSSRRASAGSSEPLDASSAADADALSIEDVETLFDDARPPQGQFPTVPDRPRLLRPRLVLRFRLWR